jgi:hypothetical protein
MNNPNALWTVAGQNGVLAPMVNFNSTVELMGGGFDGTIGVSALKLGFLGNLIQDTRVVDYGGGHALNATFTNPLPLLDTTTLVINGGTSVYRGSSHETRIEIPEGYQSTITGYDLPAVGFFANLNFGGAVGVRSVQAITGTVSFKDYLSAVSLDFNLSYTSLQTYDWTYTPSVVPNAGGGYNSAGSSVVLQKTPTPDGLIPPVTSGPTTPQSVTPSDTTHWN